MSVGVDARLVRWPYLLPDVVPETHQLPSRLGMHRAVQVRLQGRWMVVDGTHHSGLAGTALTVADWDGREDTLPGYEPAGPVLVESVDVEAIDDVLLHIKDWVDACPPGTLGRWRSAYMRWLRQHEGARG